ncbi:MAG: aspartate aminotransferase family protein [Cyclobacteriaceae bacterium]
MNTAFSEKIFLENLAQTSPFPFKIPVERAEGVWLYGPEPEQKRWMDFISGIAVANVGHRHPKVVAAIKEQVDRHLHVMAYGEYIQSASNKLAEKLSELLPPSLNCTYLVNSGTEANEGALKLAKRITGRTEIISFHRSYHGSTHGSLSVSGNEVKKNAFRPLIPDVRFIHFNKPEDLQYITNKTAAVIVETIQGDAGVRIPDISWMQALRKRCDDTGAILILDEIQCGMGRTGTLFAFEQFGIVPDILTIAKAFGGGLPIGAFIASTERMALLTHNPMLGHITTFGGNPVCAAAALATLEVLSAPDLLNSVEEKGKLIESLIAHPKIKEIRRNGMMFAVDFESDATVKKIVDYALENGVICFWFLSHPASFRIAPPLTITEDEIRFGCEVIRRAIDQA